MRSRILNSSVIVTVCAGALGLSGVGSAQAAAAAEYRIAVADEEAAYLLIRVATGAEKTEHLGAVLGSLAAEVTGIAVIRNNC